MKNIEKNNASQPMDDDWDDYDAKVRVECICPKCNKRHQLQFHWSGKGTPRKFCKKCRGGLE